MKTKKKIKKSVSASERNHTNKSESFRSKGDVVASDGMEVWEDYLAKM